MVSKRVCLQPFAQPCIWKMLIITFADTDVYSCLYIDASKALDKVHYGKLLKLINSEVSLHLSFVYYWKAIHVSECLYYGVTVGHASLVRLMVSNKVVCSH